MSDEHDGGASGYVIPHSSTPLPSFDHFVYHSHADDDSQAVIDFTSRKLKASTPTAEDHRDHDDDGGDDDCDGIDDCDDDGLGEPDEDLDEEEVEQSQVSSSYPDYDSWYDSWYDYRAKAVIDLRTARACGLYPEDHRYHYQYDYSFPKSKSSSTAGPRGVPPSTTPPTAASHSGDVPFTSEPPSTTITSSSQPHAQGTTKRRRAKRTEEERIEYLRADPYVAQFEAYRVLNNKSAYALDQRNMLFTKDPDIRKFDAERVLCNSQRRAQKAALLPDFKGSISTIRQLNPGGVPGCIEDVDELLSDVDVDAEDTHEHHHEHDHEIEHDNEDGDAEEPPHTRNTRSNGRRKKASSLSLSISSSSSSSSEEEDEDDDGDEEGERKRERKRRRVDGPTAATTTTSGRGYSSASQHHHVPPPPRLGSVSARLGPLPSSSSSHGAKRSSYNSAHPHQASGKYVAMSPPYTVNGAGAKWDSYQQQTQQRYSAGSGSRRLQQHLPGCPQQRERERERQWERDVEQEREGEVEDVDAEGEVDGEEYPVRFGWGRAPGYHQHHQQHSQHQQNGDGSARRVAPVVRRPNVGVGLADLDSVGGRKQFIASSILHLFTTTYESTDDLPISSLLTYLNAAMPVDKHEDFDTAEVVKYVVALSGMPAASAGFGERWRVVLQGDIVRIANVSRMMLS
ncbi:hypothetical protein MD484_g8254, partial [Candolleomyces efflorescens]